MVQMSVKGMAGGVPAGPALVLVLILAAVLLVPGCATNGSGNHTGPASHPVASATPVSAALYRVTIPQEDGSHADDLIMDSDVYNEGEVVEFFVANGGTEPIRCGSSPFTYIVQYRKTDGTWGTLPEPADTVAPVISYLKPNQATAPRRFATTGWPPGLYRIVYDCGISREFMVRTIPLVVPVNNSG
ncbi:MAG TPA: hypothetical protein VEI81_01515 [Methanoregula sp.]|nr:hypothetical protein [Methanoregula sp.]